MVPARPIGVSFISMGEKKMEVLLFAGILLLILALLGFGGVVGALRSLARVLLLAGAVMIVLSVVL